ncbi:acyl-CoA dehydrogenase family protein [uncultured Roseibium sp.]|uniref:acyl-CoA dehydrogenase family protein n=1 Tax=uncultured Roseibium sp. TaxID=1936171 RepID=UPI003217422B
MTEIDTIVTDTATRLFKDLFTAEVMRRAEAGEWLAEAWAALADAGIPHALIPEEHGGFGISERVAADLIRLAGFHAVPLPLVETMLGARLLATAGLDVPEGPLAFAAIGTCDHGTLVAEGKDWRLAGKAARVPWAREASAIVALVEEGGTARLVRVDRGGWRIEEGANLALEPRDTVTFDTHVSTDAVADVSLTGDALRMLGAGLRSLQIAGALDAVLTMTVDYAGERKQFGRPIGKFQAIQQSLAILAAQTAAASGAAELAAECLMGSPNLLLAASAKARAGEAAGAAAAIAHQIHGAIGFTHEHALHFHTRRLWSWRDEFGGEAEWTRRLGEAMIAGGADDLWPTITAA